METDKRISAWGLGLTELRSMFHLRAEDLSKDILMVGDEGTSFAADLREQGGKVRSLDPTYELTPNEMRQRFYKNATTFERVIHRQYRSSTPERLGHIIDARREAWQRFMADYEQPVHAQYYLSSSYRHLPFSSQRFDISLCLIAMLVPNDEGELHEALNAMREQLRVAREVRCFPIISRQNTYSKHLIPVLSHLEGEGYQPSIHPGASLDGDYGTLVIRSSY